NAQEPPPCQEHQRCGLEPLRNDPEGQSGRGWASGDRSGSQEYLAGLLRLWSFSSKATIPEMARLPALRDQSPPGCKCGSQHPPKSSSLTPTRARTEPSGIACVGRLDEPRSPGLQSGESSHIGVCQVAMPNKHTTWQRYIYIGVCQVAMLPKPAPVKGFRVR